MPPGVNMGGMLTGRFPWAQLKSDVRQEIQDGQPSPGTNYGYGPGSPEGQLMNRAVDKAMAEIEAVEEYVRKRVSEIVASGIRMVQPSSKSAKPLPNSSKTSQQMAQDRMRSMGMMKKK